MPCNIISFYFRVEQREETYDDVEKRLAFDVERDVLDDDGGGDDLVVGAPTDGRGLDVGGHLQLGERR